MNQLVVNPVKRGNSKPHAASAPEPIIPAIGTDGRLFPIGKLKAHVDGTLHLAVSVFVFCGPNLLIQKRATSKYHCGDLWANSCCTHPHWDEAPAISARRRLQEELGLDLALTPANVIEYYADVSDNLIEHERVQVYRAEVDHQDLDFHLAPEEVSAVRWVSVPDLQAEAKKNPHLYAPWFRIYLARWHELGL